ncbi:MAG: insulinase family protein [Ignavibacterium sp.]|nr:insulinase family protein [Ignavibacterium sp.]
MNNYNLTSLSNGILVVSEFIPYVKSFSLGFWYNTGSRDENINNNGISHFIEHMLFKGTQRRTAKQISDEIESIGGYLNAFTSKENTCYYGRGLSENFKKTFTILSDMIQNPLFKEHHINKESGVVVDELFDIEDNPEELIFDKFEETIFEGNTLSFPIIGTEQNISKFNSSNLHKFHQTRYRSRNLVIAVSGFVQHDEVVKLADKYFNIAKSFSNGDRKTFSSSIPKDVTVDKDIQQVHCIIGRPAYGYNNTNRIKLSVLSTLLGEGSSSRLFQAVREKMGMTYQINSFLNSYLDVSAFGIYYSTNERHADKVNKIVFRELNKLKAAEVKQKELKRVKEYIKGNTLLSLESTTNRMIRMATSILNYGRLIPVEEMMQRIESVTAGDIIETANKMFDESELSRIIIRSKDNSIKKAA